MDLLFFPIFQSASRARSGVSGNPRAALPAQTDSCAGPAPEAARAPKNPVAPPNAHPPRSRDTAPHQRREAKEPGKPAWEAPQPLPRRGAMDTSFAPPEATRILRKAAPACAGSFCARACCNAPQGRFDLQSRCCTKLITIWMDVVCDKNKTTLN